MTAQLNNKQATVSQRLKDMAMLLGNERWVIGVHCSRTHIVQVFEGLDGSVVSQCALCKSTNPQPTSTKQGPNLKFQSNAKNSFFGICRLVFGTCLVLCCWNLSFFWHWA